MMSISSFKNYDLISISRPGTVARPQPHGDRAPDQLHAGRHERPGQRRGGHCRPEAVDLVGNFRLRKQVR